jgi:hypothetical protein
MEELILHPSPRVSVAQRRQQIGRCRRQVPQNLLRRFDHLTGHGRAPVARLSDAGGCGNCHVQLPRADVLELKRAQEELHLCPFCGCFLYSLPASAPVTPGGQLPKARRRIMVKHRCSRNETTRVYENDNIEENQGSLQS